MTVLHLLYSGGTGGIEKLCKDISLNSVKTKNVFTFVSSGGCFYEEIKNSGKEVYLLNLKNKNILKLKNEIFRLKKQTAADVIVIHHPAPLIWLASILMMLTKKNKTKLLVYAHNNYSEITSRKIWKECIYRYLLKKCDGVIAISEFVKQSILKKVPIKKEKIHVVYNGINVSQYKFNAVKDKDTLHIIFVGRLIREKGVHVLIDSMKKLSNDCDAFLTIVGDGPARVELEKQVKTLNLNDRIIFTGIRNDIPNLLSNSDIFVHPAVWEEGFGITIIEAMASGLICVAFNKGAIPEILQNGKNGFIVEETSSEALYKQLVQIYENIQSDGIAKIREAAINRAKHFSIEKVVDRLDELYKTGNASI